MFSCPARQGCTASRWETERHNSSRREDGLTCRHEGGAVKDYAERFYKSTAWQNCRAAYASAVGGLCERCLAKGMYSPGEIVHHKIHLTPANIQDPDVSLNFDNLELLCRLCHADEHQRKRKRYRVDASGRVIAR